MIGWKDFANLQVFKSLRFKSGAVITTENADGSTSDLAVSELAALDGISATDLAKIDGITNGTQAANKAVVADANVNTGVSKVTQLHIGASGSETQVTATAAELNYVDIASLGTGAASKAVVLDANGAYVGPTASTTKFTWSVTSTSTDGGTSVEPFVHNTTMTGVGGVGGRAHFTMTTNVALGGWSNALKAEAVYQASGKTTGLGSAFVAEMTLSAGTAAGTYAPVEIELNLGSGASTGTNTSLIYASVNGADAATFDTNGALFNIAGVSAGDTKFFDNTVNITNVNEITAGLRVIVAGAEYYLLMATKADVDDA